MLLESHAAEIEEFGIGHQPLDQAGCCWLPEVLPAGQLVIAGHGDHVQPAPLAECGQGARHVESAGHQDHAPPATRSSGPADIASLLGCRAGCRVEQDPIRWQPQLHRQVPCPERLRRRRIPVGEAHPSTAGHQQRSAAPAQQPQAREQAVTPLGHFHALPRCEGRSQAAPENHHRIRLRDRCGCERCRLLLQPPDQLAADHRHGEQPHQPDSSTAQAQPPAPCPAARPCEPRGSRQLQQQAQPQGVEQEWQQF